MRSTGKSVSFRLPWPPSINHYWRRCGARYFISKAGTDFRAAVIETCRDMEKLTGRLGVSIELIAPTRVHYDIDNRIKSVLDSLQHATLFDDDEQIDQLYITRLHIEKPGACDVTITEIGGTP